MDQDTLYSLLEAAFARVRAKGSDFAGVDRVTPAKWAASLEDNTQALAAALATDRWRPSRLQRVRLKKADGRRRLLGLPTLADRMVIELLRQVIEPRVEALLGDNVLAYRPGRGTKQAMRRMEEAVRGGTSWVGLADIHEFFDHIRLDRLWPRIEALLSRHPQGAFWGQLCRKLLHAHSAGPGRGLAQGSSLSPALSNLALASVDQRLARAGFSWMRYSDDLCLLADSQGRVKQGLELLARELKPLGLKLGQERVTQAREGFLWLGFWVTHQGRSVSQGALEALRQRSQRLHQRYQGEELEQRLETLVRGWRNYYDAPLPRGVKMEPHEQALQDLLGLEGPPPPEEEDPTEDARASLLWRGQEQDEVARLLDQVDALAAQGHYAQAQELALRAQALQETQDEPPAPEDQPEAPGLELDQERAEVFLGLFCAGDVRCEWGTPGQEPGRREFREVDGSAEPEQLLGHLVGEGALAVRPRGPDGLCSLGVIDIDAQTPEAQPSAEAFAAALSYTAQAQGWATLRESTGGRGVHLWFPLERAIQATQVARALEWLVRRTGQPTDGIKLEILPGADDAPELHQQAMTLPLGVHLETGQRSRLYDGQGRELTADLEGIFAVQPTDPELLRGCLRPDPVAHTAGGGLGPRPDWSPEHSGAQVKRVMEGCPVLRHLVDKAATVGHLDHGERLSLLFTLGHLGKPGERALHGIIGTCSNYDVIETNRQIAKLSGLPMGCARMRQKHARGELLAQCSCDFGDMGRRGGYPTPLLHTMGFRRDWKRALRGRPAGRRAPTTSQGAASQGTAPASGEAAATPARPQRPAVDLREQISLQLRDPEHIPLPPPHTWA
jgi:RNA-directed DNA polymerase